MVRSFGFLMVHVVIGFQQRAQKLQLEELQNDSFAGFDAEEYFLGEQQAFKEIQNEFEAAEKSFSEDGRRLYSEYKQAYEASLRETLAEKLTNERIQREFENVSQANERRRGEAVRLREDGMKLERQILRLRSRFNTAMGLASMAVGNADIVFDERGLEVVFEKEPPRRQEMSLLRVNRVSATNSSFDSMKMLLEQVIRHRTETGMRLQASFEREMQASATERGRYLLERKTLEKKLADAKATGKKLRDAIHKLESTNQHLRKVESALTTALPNDVAATVADAALATGEAAKLNVKEAGNSTKWADLAFQIHGSQEDFQSVISAKEADREGAYDIVKNGLEFWPQQALQLTGKEADYKHIMAVDPLRRKAAYEALTRGEEPESVSSHGK